VLAVVLALVLIRLQGFAPVPTMLAVLSYAVGDLPSLARTSPGGCRCWSPRWGSRRVSAAGCSTSAPRGRSTSVHWPPLWSGAYVGPLLSGLHLLLCLAAAALAGGAIAGGLGWLRAHWGVDEVLSTLLSNYLLILLCAYLANGPLRDPTRQSGSTRTVHDTAMFPVILPRTELTAGLFLVVGLAGFAWWLSERSVAGYRWRMTGRQPRFRGRCRVRRGRGRIACMAVSGALCGLGGALLVMTLAGPVLDRDRHRDRLGCGTAALVGRARPVGVILWAAGYCVMRASAAPASNKPPAYRPSSPRCSSR